MSTQDRNSPPPEAPLSDAEFDAYLRRDSQISAQYREQDSGALPPPSLDRAVLSQAHAAASATQRARLVRWSGPLALAASVVVVVSLVFEPTMQKEISQSAVPAAAPEASAFNESTDSAVRQSLPREMQRPPSVGAGAPPSIDAGEPKRSDSQRSEPQQAASPTVAPQSPSFALEAPADEAERKATAKAEASREHAARSARRTAPPPPQLEMPPDAAPTTAIRQTTSIAPPPAPAPAPSRAADAAGGASSLEERSDMSLSEVVVTAMPRKQANAAAGPRGSVSPSRARQEADEAKYDKPSEQSSAQSSEETNPGAWLERIRELRRANRGAAADREWQRFVKQYPDYVVDAADLARPAR